MSTDFRRLSLPGLARPRRWRRIRDEVLAALVEHLIAAGVHGLTPLGSTGEFAYLHWAQSAGVVEVTLAAAAGRVPVVPGRGGDHDRDAVRQATEFERMGCAGILAILEAYFPSPRTAWSPISRAIAQAVDLPVVLYTNPQFQRSDLSLAAIERLAAIPNIRYIKDASTNTGRLLSIMNLVGDRLRIFAASAHIPACVMLLGGRGWMAGPACLIRARASPLRPLSGRSLDRGDGVCNASWRINQAFAKYALAACIKAGLELQGSRSAIRYRLGAP